MANEKLTRREFLVLAGSTLVGVALGCGKGGVESATPQSAGSAPQGSGEAFPDVTLAAPTQQPTPIVESTPVIESSPIPPESTVDTFLVGEPVCYSKENAGTVVITSRRQDILRHPKEGGLWIYAEAIRRDPAGTQIEEPEDVTWAPLQEVVGESMLGITPLRTKDGLVISYDTESKMIEITAPEGWRRCEVRQENPAEPGQ